MSSTQTTHRLAYVPLLRLISRLASPQVPGAETLAITISLFSIVFFSIVFGATLPLLLKSLGTDPAHSSTSIQVIMDILGVVFTDPQVAIVGLTEAALKTRDLDYLSAEYPFDDHGKSILMGAKYGYVRVFAEKKTGIVLGAECVSKDAGELIHSLAVAITMKASVKDLLKVHWYHPTLSEIWSYPIEDIVDQM